MKNPLRRLLESAKPEIALKAGKTEDTGRASPRVKDAAAASADAVEEDEILDVLIIGAGFAGLAAGRKLWEASQKKPNRQLTVRFRVLEGHSQIGGRSRTLSPISDEYPVSMCEMGSQWIHGVHRKNPVYQLALKHDMILHYDEPFVEGEDCVWIDKLKTSATNKEEKLVVERMDGEAQLEMAGLAYGKKGFFAYLQKYPKRQKQKYQQQRRRGSCDKDKDPPPVSVQHVFEEYVKIKQLTPEQKQHLLYMIEGHLTQDYSASLEDIDAKFWDHDKEFSGGDCHFGLHSIHANRGSRKGGYSALIREYAEPIKDSISCNCIVTSIDHQANPVVVDYTDVASSNPSTKRVRAHKVLCTVPLGVLKAGSIVFVPRLPESKQSAIQRLGMGDYSKIMLVWKPEQRHQLPWLSPSAAETLQAREELLKRSKHSVATAEKGKATHLQWMGRVRLPGEPYDPWRSCSINHTHLSADAEIRSPIVLCFWVGGRMAREVESNLSDQDIQQQAMSALRVWFDDADIPEPQQVICPRWSTNPLCNGSYSYYKVGSSYKDRQELEKPVNHKLFFAGEANHIKYFATTHGALMSGQTSAQAILKSFYKERRQRRSKRHKS